VSAHTTFPFRAECNQKFRIIQLPQTMFSSLIYCLSSCPSEATKPVNTQYKCRLLGRP